MKDRTRAWATAPCFARRTVILLALLLTPFTGAFAQGVTTGALTGVVTDTQMRPVAGASVIAIHEPSGTTYEGITRADGRYQIPGMRVGGPYSITVNFVGAGTAFEPQTTNDVTVNLGAPVDVNFNVKPIAVQEQVSVVATVDPVFSSGHTGASTSVDRETIGLIPTFQGRISDVTRLSPQSNGTGFAGQDNRMNNITVDGSSFNNSFGLGGQPGDRTGVAPISLEAVEQVQVSVAPFDVRQGSFIGAGVNTVTRSGTNQFSGTFYHNFRNQDWVGTESKGTTVNPGTFTFRNTGGSASGPIIRNRWFAFGNYEDQADTRPLWSTRANKGGEPTNTSVSRVLESDLTALSSYLKSNFNYDTGPFDNIDKETPVKRFLIRSDYNISNASKVSFRFNYLDSFTDVATSQSASALLGRSSAGPTFLAFQNSNYKILENIRSGIGEWNTVFGTSVANSLQSGYTTQDESRDSRGTMFPFIDIREGGTAYTSFGFEPFTVNNELRYQTFQIQDNVSKFTANHSFTFGGYLEKYHSDNVFFGCCPQGAWEYNSLADFYADANGYLANPNRTTSPVTAGAFQVRWANLPGLDKPSQPLDVWYHAYYAQDEWRPVSNFTLTAGVRADVSSFENTAYRNAAADALTFRDENGNSVQYDTGSMPKANILWSPRAGFNWDVAKDQMTQVRGGSGLFSGRPAYVWISNQIGNTGVLIGETRITAPTNAFPYTPDASRYRGVATGAGATSYALNVTDPDFKFPQVWRSNIAVDRKLPGGLISTTEYLYAKDVNAVFYIDANLPAPQSAFTGVDARPRWVGTPCSGNGNVGGCVTRINATPGNVVTNAYVLKNTDLGHQWMFSESLNKTFGFGLSVRGAYSYGRAYSVSDPESTASTSFSRNSTFNNPNDAVATESLWSPGHRVFALVTFSREYFSFGATSVSAFWEARPSTNTGSTRVSYTFAGDANNDAVSGNDLIYVPKDQSEMSFSAFTAPNGVTFSAAEQAAAFDQLISSDSYLNSRRGKYVERNGSSFPMMRNLDLTIAQQIFHNVGGKRNAFQIRADFLNFGNLLNHNWGAGWRPVATINNNNQVQLLTNPAADANGRLSYRLATANNQLIQNLWQNTSGTGDVYQFQLSLRYSFN
jgi:outer membrane receptor protein involved in Fe transport